MKKVKITVLRKQLYEDLAEKYLTDGKDVECDYYQEGETFIYSGGAEMPEGFCPWAWDDLYKVIAAFYANGKFDMWTEGGRTIVACCTDGTRPVYFKIEAIA